MKINLAKSAGFCFGVKRAIKTAFNAAKLHKNIEMLGDIVHNEKVVREIKKTGIKKVKRLHQGLNKKLLIRAHGASAGTFKRAKKLGYEIIDATCPMVKEIHKIAGHMEKKGYKIIVVGDKNHDEVQGIIGQLKNKAIVLNISQKLSPKEFRGIEKAAVVVQSTQNMEKVSALVDTLKRHIKNLEFFNTICKTTRIKQNEIQTLPRQNDVMIVIGSKNSANTRRLYEISKSLNKQSYWISSLNSINPRWFRNAENVGVTAGASTPDSTTEEIINYIKKIMGDK